MTVTSVAQGAATVYPPRLTFTASTWDVPQVVTVTGVDDAVDNPGDERLAAVLHNISGGGYDEVPAAVLVTVLDDDDRVGLTLSPSSVTVSEAGGEASYTAVLNEQPTGTVTVTVAGDAPAAAEVRPAVLTFTRVNWNRAAAGDGDGRERRRGQSRGRAAGRRSRTRAWAAATGACPCRP